MPNYSYVTLAQAQNELAARLYENLSNPSQDFWTAAELTYYITEALRTWNALTSFWRAEFTFQLQQATNWYDLTAQANTLRPYTVTDQYLTNLIEYHLLEPQTSLNPSSLSPATWTGSSQFSLSDIYGAMTRRQNEILGATGCTVTRSLVPAPIVRTGIILADTALDIRRVAWIPRIVNPQDYDVQIMRQSDAWAKRAFDYNYTASAEQPPSTWLQSTEPPPRFDVDYVPPVPGQYEVLSIASGNVVVPTAAQLLSIPDDWSWVLKWGVLADLLGREAEAKDVARAQYCQKRYQESVEMLAGASSVLALQMNGLPMNVGAVKDGDNFNSSWESLTQTQPDTCYATGLNLLGFPTPDNGTYGNLVTVVQNAPVPVNSGDEIQVQRSVYDAIIDEAQHIAAFKQGGAEFTRTIPLHQNFIAQASLYNSKLRVMGQFQQEEYRLSHREEELNRRVAAQ